jgi:capsular exopolysaccharide synthesis family protein
MATTRSSRPLNSPTPAGFGIDPSNPEGLTEVGPLEKWWAILKRRKWAVLQAFIIIPLTVFAITLTQEERYTATATLLFQGSTLGAGEEESVFVDPDRAAATNVDLASLPVVAELAGEELGVDPALVEQKVEVKSSATSDLADIDATSRSPDEAARTANAYAEAYIEFRRSSKLKQLNEGIRQLEASLAELTPIELEGPRGIELREQLDRLRLAASVQTGNAELVQKASPPDEPSSPDLKRNLFLGFILAAAVALALAALLERIDRAVRDVGELEELYGLPVLARIPRSKALGGKDHRISDLVGKFGEVEAFRTLRANLGYFNFDGRINSVLIVSPLAGDGKSTVADFLAMTMASMGDSVILLETDLHKSDGTVGLSSVLAGADLRSAIMEVNLDISEQGQARALHKLAGGPPPPNPFELLESDRMGEVLEELESMYDLVLLDSPALSAVSDALALVPKVSGVLVIGALGHTSRDSALDLRKQLILAHGNPLGVVANFTSSPRGYRYYYGPSPSDRPA